MAITTDGSKKLFSHLENQYDTGAIVQVDVNGDGSQLVIGTVFDRATFKIGENGHPRVDVKIDKSLWDVPIERVRGEIVFPSPSNELTKIS